MAGIARLWYNNQMMPLPQPPAKKNLLAAILVLGLGAVLTVSAAQGRGGFLASVFDGSGLQGGLGAAQQEVSGSGINTSSSLVAVIIKVANAIIPYAGIATLVAFVVAALADPLGEGVDGDVQRRLAGVVLVRVGLGRERCRR